MIPDDVRYALDRMSHPLDESRLSGVTAEEDARCMRVIRAFVDELTAVGITPLPDNRARLTAAVQIDALAGGGAQLVFSYANSDGPQQSTIPLAAGQSIKLQRASVEFDLKINLRTSG